MSHHERHRRRRARRCAHNDMDLGCRACSCGAAFDGREYRVGPTWARAHSGVRAFNELRRWFRESGAAALWSNVDDIEAELARGRMGLA